MVKTIYSRKCPCSYSERKLRCRLLVLFYSVCSKGILSKMALLLDLVAVPPDINSDKRKAFMCNLRQIVKLLLIWNHKFYC